MSDNHHLDDQMAIYALGALTGQAKLDFEKHVQGCEYCRARLREARAMVDLLPRSVQPIQPSPDTKKKLFARVDADLARQTNLGDAKPALRPRMPSLSGRSVMFALGVLVILVLAALVGIPYIGQINQQREIAGILGNPQAETRVILGTQDAPGAQAKLVAEAGDTRAVLVVSGLKALPLDKTYEFWLIRGSQPFPAGLFDVDPNGGQTFLVTAGQSISTFDKLGVTIEERPGEQAPKGTLVLKYGF